MFGMHAAVVHPFAEHIAYFMLFSIPMLTVTLTGIGSIVSFAGYVTYIDFMNNLGHCNFELIPNKLFSIFPPLKHLMYTPTYVSSSLNSLFKLPFFFPSQNECLFLKIKPFRIEL